MNKVARAILEEDKTPQTDKERTANQKMVAEMKVKHPVLYKRHQKYYDDLCK